MGPSVKDHDSYIMDHVTQLATLRSFCDSNKESTESLKDEVKDMGKRVGIVESDLTVLKVKFATYSAIAVFVANIVYNIVMKIVGG